MKREIEDLIRSQHYVEDFECYDFCILSGKDPLLSDCKEQAMYLYKNAKGEKPIIFFIPNSLKNIKSVEKGLNKIETVLKIRPSNFTIYNFVQSPGHNFLFFEIHSNFWFKDLLKVEMLICIVKSIIYSSEYPNRRSLRSLLQSFYYFSNLEMRFALTKIKNLHKVLNIEIGSEKKALYNFDNNGICDLLEEFIRKNPLTNNQVNDTVGIWKQFDSATAAKT